MTRESKYAIFEYEKCDEDLIDTLAQYLDEKAHVAYDFFEVDVPQEKVKIQIVPIKAEFDQLNKALKGIAPETEMPKWSIGTYLEKRNLILCCSIHDYKNTSHAFDEKYFDKAFCNFKKTIVHEYVHHVNALFRQKHHCSYTEKFFSEGIATYLSGQKDGDVFNFDFSAEKLLNPNNNIYYAYYMITKYFVEHNEKPFVLDLIQSNRQTREFLVDELYDRAKEFYTKEQANKKHNQMEQL